MNTLHFGDNLEVLKNIKDESVDLIYLDPPFNSNATYNVLFSERDGLPSQAQADAFEDTWGWETGIAARAFDDATKCGDNLAILMPSFRAWLGDTGLTAYLSMMAVRLIEMKRILKPSGSLFLHCDPTAGHYLKLLLDAIFTAQNFRNEIIWRRSASHNKLSRQFGPIHDTILFYSASEDFVFHPGRTPYTKDYIAKMFRYQDEKGAYRLNEITGSGVRTGQSGKPWKGYNPTAKGRHWAIPASLRASLPRAGQGMATQAMLDALAKEGAIVFSPSGRPTYKQREGEGVPYQDVWAYQPGTKGVLQGRDEGIDQDVKWLDDDDERLGYPTQKPIGLLERIIESSSDEGAVILDPFCGCGTTVEAAERMKRQWIGIDIAHYAITLIERRLERYPESSFKVEGRPTTLAGAIELAKRDKHQFQWWAAWLLGAQRYEGKKGADRGIDANIFFPNGPYGFGRIIVSVKGGDNVSPVWVRELAGVVDREKADMGVLVTLAEPTRGMKVEAAGLGLLQRSVHGQKQRIQIATVAELLSGTFQKHLPPLPRPQIGIGRKRKDKDQLELMLPFETTAIMTEDGAFVDPRYLTIKAS